MSFVVIVVSVVTSWSTWARKDRGGFVTFVSFASSVLGRSVLTLNLLRGYYKCSRFPPCT